MIRVCPSCGELRECLPLVTGTMCWVCTTEKLHTKNECECDDPCDCCDVPPAVMEGVPCVRQVERSGEWAMLLVNDAPSNQSAMILGTFAWGMCSMVARPIWQKS